MPLVAVLFHIATRYEPAQINLQNESEIQYPQQSVQTVIFHCRMYPYKDEIRQNGAHNKPARDFI